MKRGQGFRPFSSKTLAIMEYLKRKGKRKKKEEIQEKYIYTNVVFLLK